MANLAPWQFTFLAEPANAATAAGELPFDSAAGLERLLAARDGDAGAGAWLVRNFGPGMLRAAWRVLGRYGAAEAEDVVQEAFIAAFTTSALPNSNLAAWLRSITVRKALDWLRQHQRRREDPITDLQAASWSTGHRDAATLDVMAARQALDRLAPGDRAVLELVEIEGCSMAEAARVLGCTMVAAKLRAVRARRKMARAVSSLEKPGAAAPKPEKS